MRTRDLKPGFFRDAVVLELPFHTRLLFAGLWCMADKKGRLEDRPKLIKAEVFPEDNVPIEKMLAALEVQHLIERYEEAGAHYIWIPKFRNHQHPHPNEPESMLPAAPSDPLRCNDNAITSPLQGKVNGVASP